MSDLPPSPGPTTRRTNGLAVASLILGIVGLLIQFFGIVNILAIVFGFVAKGQIDRGQGEGRGMAIAGIVLGFIGLAILILVLIYVGSNLTVFSR